MEPDNIGRPKKDTGLWTRIENRIYGSELYQIFVVRALNNIWSKLTYGVLALSLIGALAGSFSFNPLYHLDEMTTIEGTFLKWTKPKHGYRINIQTKDGKTGSFYVASLSRNEEKQLNAIKGKEVTCYYQREYEFHIPCIKDHIWEIDYNGKKILNFDYDSIHPRRIATRRNTVIFFLISLALLTMVYNQNKNKI